MIHYYDLVVTSRVNDNVRKYISVNRMSKDGEPLSSEEIYSILYQALTDIDKTAEQSAVFSLAPDKIYSVDNAIKLNSMLNATSYLGTKIELIEVVNANSPERDMGYCCYMKLNKDSTFNNVYTANLYSYTGDNTTISEMESDLIDLIIASPEIKDILNLADIADLISANKKLNVPYYSEDLKRMIKAWGIEYEVVGEFE